MIKSTISVLEFQGQFILRIRTHYLRLCLCNFNTACPHIIKIPTSTAGKIWRADLESGWKKKAQTLCVAILYCPHSLKGFSNVAFVLADEVSHTEQMISGITQWKHLGEQVRNKKVAGMCSHQLRQARSWFGRQAEVGRVGAYFLCFNCIYLFLSLLGLHCRAGFSLVVESGGYSLASVPGLLIAVASLWV